MKNTRINYLYRDADNYKAHNECVIHGAITPEQIATILDSLDDGEYFIPKLVGLPERKFDTYDPQVDHPFFVLDEYSFESTDAPATVELTIGELADRFSATKDRWLQIEPQRAIELLHILIDEKVNDEGGHADRVVKRLAALGFSKGELLFFQFQKSDINDALSEVCEC